MNQPIARWLTAAEAAELLGVQRPTLYAYVSRGLLASAPGGEASRERRYRRSDVERLARERGRREPAAAVRDALDWGELPVLDSAISEIADGSLRYRGRPVEALVRTSSFPQVVALLWEVEALEPVAAVEPRALLAPLVARGALTEAFQAALALEQADDLRALHLHPEVVRALGSQVLAVLVATATGRPADASDPARSLAAAWSRSPAAARLLDAVLVVCADHELNVSTFAARCVASADASLYAAVSAGIGALAGGRHGRPSEWARTLLDEAAAGDPRAALQASLRRHALLPGFGHRLHQSGDPRGSLLLELLADELGEAAEPARQLAAMVADALGLRPNVDFGLAAVASALALPAGAELGLFAISRSAGWVAHSLEQYAAHRLIRPRARYVGP